MPRDVEDVIIVPFKPGDDHCFSVADCIYKALPSAWPPPPRPAPFPLRCLFRGSSTVAVISRATDAGNFAVLLGATVVMAATVVTMNRLFWRKMYGLASTRYKLEG